MASLTDRVARSFSLSSLNAPSETANVFAAYTNSNSFGQSEEFDLAGLRENLEAFEILVRLGMTSAGLLLGVCTQFFPSAAWSGQAKARIAKLATNVAVILYTSAALKEVKHQYN